MCLVDVTEAKDVSSKSTPLGILASGAEGADARLLVLAAADVLPLCPLCEALLVADTAGIK